MRVLVFRVIGFCLWAFCLSGFQRLGAQNDRGFPLLRNYDIRDFKTEPHNTSITQDDRGFIYAGNSKGILVYDAVSWRIIGTRNQSMVNSLAKGADGKIYVGGFNEIGYLEESDGGNLEYRALVSREDEQKLQLNLVWATIPAQKGVYFQTDFALYYWSDSVLRKVVDRTLIQCAARVRDEVYISLADSGLFRVNGLKIEAVKGNKALKNKSIHNILPFGADQFLLVIDKTLYRFDGEKLTVYESELNALLRQYSVYCAAQTPNGMYAFGSLQGGLFVMDATGKLYDWVNRTNGLQNNLVHDIYADDENGIWLALDRGVSRIDLPSPLTLFNEMNGIEEEPKAVVQHKGRLYVATNQGVYRQEGKLANSYPRFSKLNGSSAQNWTFLEVDGDLFIGSTAGVYQVVGDGVKPISMHSYNLILYRSSRAPNLFFSAGMAKLEAYQKQNGQWKYAGRIDAFNREVNSLVEDSLGYLWAGSSYQGVARVDCRKGYLSASEVAVFDTALGLPSMHNNRVYRVAGRPLFTTNNGFYRFDYKKNRFVPDAAFNNFFLDSLRQIVFLREEADGSLWLIAKSARSETPDNQEIYIGTPTPDGSYRWRRSRALRHIRQLPIHTIYNAPNNGSHWIITLEGLFRFDETIEKNYRKPFRTHIRRILAGRDSILFNGYAQFDTASVAYLYAQSSLSFDYNTLRFDVACPFYEDEEGALYQYYLEGLEDGWSDWTNESFKLYTLLPEGSYKFRVRAKNIYDQMSLETVFVFRVRPPWYRTWAAIFTYIVLFFVFSYGFLRFRLARLQVEKMILEDHVERRTIEIRRKNEEIQLQSQEIAEQNQELQRAAFAIEQSRKELEKANYEIISQNKTITEYYEQLSSAFDQLGRDNDRKTHELEDARNLQMAMLPAKSKKLDSLDFEIEFLMQSAAEVGGDYYDYDLSPDGVFTLVVGDATGHGLKAAFIVSTVKSYFKFKARTSSMENLLTEISNGIAAMNLTDMYMAMGILQYHNRHAELILAGIPPVLLYRRESRAVEVLDKYGLFLGADFPMQFERVKVELAPGDALLMTSDGLAETFNEREEMLGYQRVADYFAEIGHLPAREVVEKLKAFGLNWSNGVGFSDDMTLALLRLKG